MKPQGHLQSLLEAATLWLRVSVRLRTGQRGPRWHISATPGWPRTGRVLPPGRAQQAGPGAQGPGWLLEGGLHVLGLAGLWSDPGGVRSGQLVPRLCAGGLREQGWGDPVHVADQAPTALPEGSRDRGWAPQWGSQGVQVGSHLHVGLPGNLGPLVSPRVGGTQGLGAGLGTRPSHRHQVGHGLGRSQGQECCPGLWWSALSSWPLGTWKEAVPGLWGQCGLCLWPAVGVDDSESRTGD